MRLVRMFRRNAVGVFGREKSAGLVRHLAHDVLQRVFGDLGIERVARSLRRLEERDDKLRLVVEHFFEVRHAPLLVDGVPVEAAADVIAHPS